MNNWQLIALVLTWLCFTSATHHYDYDYDEPPCLASCSTDEECRTYTHPDSYCKNYLPHTYPCVECVHLSLT